MSLAQAQKLLSQGMHEAALQELSGSVSPGADPRYAVTRARILADRGDVQAALDELKGVLQSVPKYAPGHLFHGIFSGDLNNFDSAMAAFERVIELQPENDVAHSYRALTLLQTGRDAEAVNVFRKRGINDNRMLRVRLTEWIEKQWLEHDHYFYKRSISGLEDVGSAEPLARIGLVESNVREWKATRSFFAKKYDRVIRELQPFTRLQAPDEMALLNCACAAELLQDYERAMGYIDQLPQDRQEWPDALLATRGRVLVRLRRFEAAIADLNLVQVNGPEDYGANYFFGVLCLAAGNREQARPLFLRSHTQYLIDTIEYWWWQTEQHLLGKPESLPKQAPAADV